MKERRKKVSVIIVTYKEDKEVLAGLAALFKSNKGKYRWPMEVIVVDNNRQARLRSVIKRKFPQVLYVNTGKNIGFGPANNVGAKAATGEYLFFLNPDTEIEKGSVYHLGAFLDAHPDVAIVAPTLCDMNGNIYEQGSEVLTPLTAVASTSIFHRIWPTNPIAYRFWRRERDMSLPQQVITVPGTAIMIRRSVFEAIRGFDERFFIYFEENDLCRRVHNLKWQAWIIPAARLRHVLHAATQSNRYSLIFTQSRYKYFEKYYGQLVAKLMEILLNLGKRELLWALLLLFSLIIVTNLYATVR